MSADLRTVPGSVFVGRDRMKWQKGETMAQHSAHAVTLLAEATGEREPVLLHRCRGGRAPYDWRATATVGRFLCRGCGITGQCGACAELAGQRIAPGVVPVLCAFHGGLLEIGIAEVAL